MPRNVPERLPASKVEATIAREHDEGKRALYVPEIPPNLKSVLGFETSEPAVRRAFRKAWLTFRKYERRQSRKRRGRSLTDVPRDPDPDAHTFRGDSRKWRSMIVADWLLWKMCPVNERPSQWPRSERELAERHGTSEAALSSILVRIQAPLILNAMMLPMDPEDLNRKADRLLQKTLSEQEKLKADERDPRWVTVAYQRTGAISKANQVSKTQINVQGDFTQNVLQLSASERKEAEERLRLHASRHYREVPRETEATVLSSGPDGEQRGTAEAQPPQPDDDPPAS